MGACSGSRPSKSKTVIPPQQKQKQNFLTLWNDLNQTLLQIDRNVENDKTLAKIKGLFQIRGTIEEMILNQTKRSERNKEALSDNTFQYNLLVQVERINSILSDYLFIDRAFEERNAQILDKLQQCVEQIEKYRNTIKIKGNSRQNQSTNFSNTNVY